MNYIAHVLLSIIHKYLNITDPDCYQLVSKEDIIHVSTTTATKSTHSDGNNTS